MTTEHLTDQDICLYVDALKLQKTEQLPPDIVAHVSDCIECKKQIMQLYDALSGEDYRHLRDHPTFGPQKGVKREPARLVLRLAAGIVVLLAAGAIAYFAFLRNAHEAGPPTRAATVDSTGISNPKTVENPTSAGKFAANFSPSPNMEDLVGSTPRAASVTVNSPTNGQTIRENIVFRWKSHGTMTFKVRILNNREGEVFRATTDRDSVLYDQRLDPGLYYWTLQADGELVHVGKFTVAVP